MLINKLFSRLRTKLFSISGSFYLVLAIIWTVLTIYLSLVSAKRIATMHIWNIAGIDKIAHAVFYLSFSFLWSMTFFKKLNVHLWVLLITIVFGIAIEWAQFQMNIGRAFEILDIIANAIGATIGILIFIWLRPKSAVEN